jgi:multiple sugar transport system permease protein
MSARGRSLSAPAAFARHLLLGLSAAFMLLPFVWMLAMSAKSPGEMFQASPSLLPERWHLVENYGAALSKAPLLAFMANGVIVCAGILLLQLAVALPFAYALAKLRFRRREALFALVLVGLLIPQQVLAIPLFILFFKLGLLNTYAAQILPWTSSVFCVFLMRQFFKTVPDEIIDAARLDGMSEIGIVLRVMLPAAMPAVVAFGIFSVVAHWNDLFWPLIVVQDERIATPPIGLMYFRNAETGNDYGPLMAGTAIVTAPLVLAFLFAQRFFIRGVTLTGLK